MKNQVSTIGLSVSLFLLLVACSSPYAPYSSKGSATAAAQVANDLAFEKARSELTEEARNHIVETDVASDYVPLPEDLATECISWKEAHLHVGEETCVTGTVTSTYNSGKAFFINFSSNRSSFYVVSFDFTWDNLRGECVVVHGEIILYENRPEIIIRDPNQLKSCR